MKFLLALLLLLALPTFGAVPAYTSFKGTSGILITSNPPTGDILISGAGVFTSSGTNATIATSTNGVLVAVASTNINFIMGSNVVLLATNSGSTTHLGINAFTPVPFIEGAVSNYLLTYILPVLAVDTLTVSNLLAAPPNASVQYNSNGVTRGSAGFIYTNGQVRVADVVIAGEGVEVTAGSFVLNGGTPATVTWNGLGQMRWDADGVARLNDSAALSFNRLNVGGTDAGFPAIGRTNGDLIVLGANGAFGGVATNRLHVPGGIVLTNANVAPGRVWTAVGGLGGGTWSNVTASGGSSVAPPISSVQFNSNGVQQGSANFTFTNGQVYINNPGAVGSAQLRLENTTQSAAWDLVIDSNPETYLLGIRNGTTYTTVWEPAGNVGIGTTNPASRLDVAGRVGISPSGLLATNALDVSGHTSLRSNLFLANLPTNGSPIAFLATDAAGTVYETAAPSGGGGTVPGGNSGAIQFNENGTFAGTNRLNYDRTNEILYVAGSVGIGTPSPSYPLDVQAATGRQRIVSTTAANEAWLLFVNNGSALIGLESGVPGTTVLGSSAYSLLLANAGAYPVQLATDNSVRVTVLPTSGNVGIATASPTNTLDVNGHTSLRSNLFLPNLLSNASPVAVLAVDAAGVVYETAVPAGGGSSVAPPISSIQFNSNGVQQGSSSFVFTNGLVGIGTPTPLAMLEVSNAAGGTTFSLAHFGTNLISGLTVATNGNVGIGIVGPVTKLHIAETSDPDSITTTRARSGVFVSYPALDTYGMAVGVSSVVPFVQGVFASTTATPIALQPYGGNVAIGSSTAIGKLEVSGTQNSWVFRVNTNGLVYTNGNVGIGTMLPSVSLDVTGAIRSASLLVSNVTASRVAAFHTDKTLTNGATATILLDNFFAMGISNINSADTAGIVIRTNAGSLTISNSGSGFSVSGNSNQIPYLNPAGNGFIFGATNRTAPGFGFSKVANQGSGSLMIHEDETNTYSLVSIGHPNLGSSTPFFLPSLNITNRFSFSGSGDKITQEVVRVTMVDVTDGSSPESFIQTWKHATDNTSEPVTLAAGIRRDGQLNVAHGVYYPSNSLASTFPTALQLGPGGHWVGISNNSLVDIYSLNGSTTAMKILAP